MAKFVYNTVGTCSKQIMIDVENGVVNDVQFLGGCHGNLQGIGELVQGMKVEDVVSRLDGIRCGNKATSCPDQLSTALKKIMEQGNGAE
ncbi:MAG: TIGR03905 family TSCPD domain-containing protein [Bacteroidaceae bacterium]|nr:TIGR03905 family TSCPD domain-containing protein [Bacteroidaceae bacterium]